MTKTYHAMSMPEIIAMQDELADVKIQLARAEAKLVPYKVEAEKYKWLRGIATNRMGTTPLVVLMSGDGAVVTELFGERLDDEMDKVMEGVTYI